MAVSKFHDSTVGFVEFPQSDLQIFQHAKSRCPVLHVIAIQLSLHEQDILNVDRVTWATGKNFEYNQVFR